MIYSEIVEKKSNITLIDIKERLFSAFDKIGKKNKVLVIPPDATRPYSRAGEILSCICEYYGSALKDVLPALGTHAAMTKKEIRTMFPGMLESLFRIHNWRETVTAIGTVPSDFIREVSEGKLQFEWPAQVASLVARGGYDLVISIGQVVPHEVAGMAGTSKNLFIGLGGEESINKSHFLGAVHGIERIMGKRANPVRATLDYASKNFTGSLPIVYVQTVTSMNGGLRGMFVGDDEDCLAGASELSLELNVEKIARPLEKVVVLLDPDAYKSTWLGNKGIYRTRMAIADGGELVLIAPGVRSFGEDGVMDALVRKYGYRGTTRILFASESNEELKENLGAAAHLIHGSSEGRFKITYCPGNLTREEIEGVGYSFGDIGAAIKKYKPESLNNGYNEIDSGETIYFISNPGLGLWMKSG